jgi:hypothetical protein
MLYYMVGRAVRGFYGDDTDLIIKGYLRDAEGIKHGDIKTWEKRTIDLLKNPKTFDYEEWCGGKLACYDFT